ncbi:hypothetical protein [Nocardia callitridis]
MTTGVRIHVWVVRGADVGGVEVVGGYTLESDLHALERIVDPHACR